MFPWTANPKLGQLGVFADIFLIRGHCQEPKMYYLYQSPRAESARARPINPEQCIYRMLFIRPG